MSETSSRRDVTALVRTIRRAWEDPACRDAPDVIAAVEETIRLLDAGAVRAAEPAGDGWVVNEWVKKAILLYFPLRAVTPVTVGPFEYLDKIPLKRNFVSARVRVVPPAVVRYGAFVGPESVLMPSYTNIGARIGSRTMIDTWATVGSCAQVGDDVHVSGGVGIGGVLEPVQAAPVIIEDGAFLGSRAIVVEGVRVGREAVLGAGVVLTASTRILDVTGDEVVEHRGVVPPRAVVIPGTRPRTFPAGEFGVPCALLIGRRTESTDRKTSLNDALRTFDVAV